MSPSAPNSDAPQKRAAIIDLPRLGLVAGTSGAIFAALYGGAEFAASHGYNTMLFGFGFLLLVPFVATIVLGALLRVYWRTGIDRTNSVTTAGAIVLLLVVALAIVASPFLLCLTIAAPLWLVGALAGGFASRWMVKQSGQAQLLLIVTLVASTAAVLGIDCWKSYPTDEYVVARAVVINAPADRIWPHLLKLDDLGVHEGRWTFSQDILGIPRPVEAIVRGDSVGAVRTGRWQRDIWFEEHITRWQSQELLEWDFVFPKGSTFTRVDQHIDPRGPNLVIETGGYRLTPLSSGSTRLELFTRYSASTAVNMYSSLWGELVLGDVQNNILAIVKQRTETSKPEPDGSPSLIAAN